MGSRDDLPAVPGKPWFKRSEDENKDEEGELEVQWNPPDYENDEEPVLNYAVYLLYSGISNLSSHMRVLKFYLFQTKYSEYVDFSF